MRISEVKDTLNARVLTEGGGLEAEVHAACGSDMMSDVLAYVKDQGMLVTGLTNPQVVRTACMMDMVCIVFVRGKCPDDTVLQLAQKMHITLLASEYTMFTACGLLYEKGLRGGANTNPTQD